MTATTLNKRTVHRNRTLLQALARNSLHRRGEVPRQPRYSAANLMAKARQKLTELDQKIAPYIVEAALRGLTVSPLLQKAYQRDAQIGQSFP